MITKALPIPVVTPFSYLQGTRPYLSLLFYSTLRLRSPGAAGQVEYIKKNIMFRKFIKTAFLLAEAAFIVEIAYFFLTVYEKLMKICELTKAVNYDNILMKKFIRSANAAQKISSGEGSIKRESGENPERSRHCDSQSKAGCHWKRFWEGAAGVHA